MLLEAERETKPDVDPAFRADVIARLSGERKAIPARWFYDRRGSELFEEITELPEYYPTRTERALLEIYACDVAKLAGPGRAVVEFGSGSSAKTPLLLGAVEPSSYVPIDISGDFLRESAAALSQRFPGLPVHPIEADFMHPIALPQAIGHAPRLGFFPGSTVGNLTAPTAVDLLRAMAGTLGVGSMLLIGMDRVKDEAALIAAYDDAQGVTAAFNLNLLHRINRELDGDIPVEAFRHVARWNDTYARIEMHLEALDAFDFEVSGRRFSLRKGETIHTENSHKFDLRSQNTLLLSGGWTPVRRWQDGEGRFSLILADWTIPRGAP